MLHQNPVHPNFIQNPHHGFQFDFFNQVDQNFYQYQLPPQQQSFENFKLDDINQNQFFERKPAPFSERNSKLVTVKSFKSPEEAKRHSERRERNNLAAKESRKKRKQRELELSKKVDQLTCENKLLKDENKKLQDELQNFKNGNNTGFFGSSY